MERIQTKVKERGHGNGKIAKKNCIADIYEKNSTGGDSTFSVVYFAKYFLNKCSSVMKYAKYSNKRI